MWIFITVICLLALSMESIADRGKLDISCYEVSDWNAMDLALINVDAEAKLVIETNKMLVERKLSRHTSRYKIDMFLMACDAQLAQARREISKEIIGKDREIQPPCGVILKQAQKIISQMDNNVGLLARAIFSKLEVINEHDRQDWCTDIEHDIAMKAAPIDGIILAVISGYRIEYEHLKSTFSLTNNKPITYQYLSLKFASDISEHLGHAKGLLDTEITQWSKLLSNYHGALEKRFTESRLERVVKRQVTPMDETQLELKTKFLDECRTRPDAKTLFTPIRESLKNRYRDELLFIPITIELRPFDHTQWKEYRDEFMREFEDQFKGLTSEYLNDPSKVAERKKLFERPTTESEVKVLSSKRGEHDLWDDAAPVYHQEIKDDLWNSKPKVYDFFIKIVNKLNEYSVDEFATARSHHNRNNNHLEGTPMQSIENVDQMKF